MELNTVVIVYKKTLHTGKLEGARKSDGLCERLPAVPVYRQILDTVTSCCYGLGAEVRVVERNALTAKHNGDLIVTVGGDGTFLAAAHLAGKTPLLGVNFRPHTSVGFFCAATPHTFHRIAGRIVSGALEPAVLPMLELKIGGKRMPLRALNDVLFSSPSPAEMSRYTLHLDGTQENQRSSGVWIAAGPGSTAAMHSAGGKKRPIADARMQYLVREPCPMPGIRYRHTHGLIPASKSISITSNMSNAVAYVDGPDLAYPVKRGERIRVSVIPNSIKAFL